MKRAEYMNFRERAVELYDKAGIVLTEHEKKNIEIADFGLNDFENIGLSIVTYVNTSRCCAKELAILPGQICPEHIHVPVLQLNYEGKEETFRCRYGTVYLIVEGDRSTEMHAEKPSGYEENFTVSHEVVLHEGEQYTLFPNAKHWFQAGEEGAVVSEFSTRSFDEYDVFTDASIKRMQYLTDLEVQEMMIEIGKRM